MTSLEWLQVGAKAAVIEDRRVTFVTIAKVGKRDVVLDGDDTRFNINHRDQGRLSKSTGEGTWSRVTSYLAPRDHPTVITAVAKVKRLQAEARLEQAYNAWRKGSSPWRTPDVDAAEAVRAVADAAQAYLKVLEQQDS